MPDYGSFPKIAQTMWSYATAVILAVFTAYHYVLTPRTETPRESLRATVTTHFNEETTRDLEANIGALLVDSLEITAHSDCVSIDTSHKWDGEGYTPLEALARTKAEGRIPSELIDEIMRRIFVPGVIRNRDSYIDTKISVEYQGEAYAHYIWFDLDAGNGHLCLVVSLLKIRTAEVERGWVEENTAEIIGFETHCMLGYFNCRQRAVTSMRTTRTPLFRNQQLTLDQHRLLRQYLTHIAMEGARKLAPPDNGLAASGSVPHLEDGHSNDN